MQLIKWKISQLKKTKKKVKVCLVKLNCLDTLIRWDNRQVITKQPQIKSRI